MESKKVLLGHHNIEGYINRQTNSIHVDGAVIIPPGMKDYLQNEGISIAYKKDGDSAEPVEQRAEKSREADPVGEDISYQDLNALTARITSILVEKHQVTDEETLARLCLNVVKEINK